MQIRAMTPNDFPQVMELEQKQHKPWPVYAFGQAMRLGHGCVVVEEGDKIIGFGVADKGHGRNIYAVNSKAALLLYKEWFETAKKQGVDVLYAETPPEEEAPAPVAMLKRFGFVISGTRPSFYGVGLDALVWTRVNPTEATIGIQGKQPAQLIDPV